MMVESCLLGLWFCQIERAQEVFSDSLSVAFLKVCKNIRPNAYSISCLDLNLRELVIDEFYQTYDDQVFLEFLLASKQENQDTLLKAGEEYLSNLLIQFDRDFPSIIFYDSNYYFEQGRVYKILEELIPLTDTIGKKLELKLLQLEYMANFYYYQHLEDSTFSLILSELEIIESCESFILENADEFQKVPESNFRIADVYFLLGDYKKGVNYYSRATVKKSSSVVDLQKFIDLTISISDATSDIEFKEKCKPLVDNAANLIVKKESPIEDMTTLKYLQNCYQFSGNDDMESRIKLKIEARELEILKQERQRERRENYGFRLGFAPLKLMSIQKYHQLSFTGDIKIIGFDSNFTELINETIASSLVDFKL
jgi:tetratricopeptide (TPR) repeat protein